MDFLVEGEVVLFNFDGGLSYKRKLFFGEIFVTNFRLVIVSSSIYRNTGYKYDTFKAPFHKLSTYSLKKDPSISALTKQKLADSILHLDKVYQFPTTRVLKKKAKNNHFRYKVILEYEKSGELRTKVVTIIIKPKRNKVLPFSEYKTKCKRLFDNLDKNLRMETQEFVSPKEEAVLEFLNTNKGKAFTSASLIKRINYEGNSEDFNSVLSHLVEANKINLHAKDQMPYYSIIGENTKKKDNSSKRQRQPITVYQFNDEISDLDELIIDPDGNLKDLLDDDFVLLFVDPQHFRIWLWHGYNTTTRMKFLAAKNAPTIRDKHGITFKIIAVDQDNEPHGFLVMLGLEEENIYDQTQIDSAYKGATEDLELLESLSEEKIRLLFEKTGICKKILICDPKSRKEENSRIDSLIDNLISNIQKNPSKKVIYLRLFLDRFRDISDQDKKDIIMSIKDEWDGNNNDDDRFPYPYIYNPPKPPDDFAMAPQVQIRAPLKEKTPEDEINCQYCGMKLTKEEQSTHSCKKKPKNK